MSEKVVDSYPVTCRLPYELVKRLEQLSAGTGKSRGTLVRESVEHHISRIEWEYTMLQRIKELEGSDLEKETFSQAYVDKILDIKPDQQPVISVDDIQ